MIMDPNRSEGAPSEREPVTTSRSQTFYFSDQCMNCSKYRDKSGTDGVYLPDLSYAMSVQKLESFIHYREETYTWMLRVCANGVRVMRRYVQIVIFPTMLHIPE